MSKIVTGAAAIVKVGGESRYLYKGEPIPAGADAEDVAHLERVGLVKEVPDLVAEKLERTNEPSVAWTGDELKAYAAEKSIDLGKAKTKAEFVAAIAEGKPLVVVEGADATAKLEKAPEGTDPAVVTDPVE